MTTILPIRSSAAVDAKVRLVCFPFAGGSAGAYGKWSALLPDVDVCAVELAGRGHRFGEPAETNMGKLVTGLLEALAPLFDRPVVLFGHSLGARIAFQLAHREPRVRGVVAAATPAPFRPLKHRRSALSRAELIRELGRLGGTHPDVLADKDLMDVMIPMLRADFGLAEWRCAPDTKVSCPLHVITAADDADITREDAEAWRETTTGAFSLTELPDGGHFFLQSRTPAVIREVQSFFDRLDLQKG